MERVKLYGNKLRELREKKGLSLTDAASRMGISKVHLSNVENRYRPVSASLIDKIKEAYKPSLEEWLNYGIGYTEANDMSVSLPEEKTQEISENTVSDSKVSNSTDREEVQIEFIWKPKIKPIKSYQLLRLDLK